MSKVCDRHDEAPVTCRRCGAALEQYRQGGWMHAVPLATAAWHMSDPVHMIASGWESARFVRCGLA